MKEDKYGHYQYFEIYRTYYKEQDQPENRCNALNGNISVKDCIESFIDSDLGCHIPWHTNEHREEYSDCSNKEQFQNYVLLSDKLSSLGAKKMELDTGCLRNCDRMEYTLWEKTPLGPKAKYRPEWLTLSFIISSGRRNFNANLFY